MKVPENTPILSSVHSPSGDHQHIDTTKERPRLKEINNLKLLPSTSRKTHNGETVPPLCNEVNTENVARQLCAGIEGSLKSSSESAVSDDETTASAERFRPLCFTASGLTPQTFKLSLGSVTILQCQSVLVDLREGERRRGRQGREVLLIDHNGSRVQVYDAPHLSTPCVLTQPMAIYTVEALPSIYWSQYNTAGKAIEKIQRRIPKFRIYQGSVKYTLMSNGPNADIEILYLSPLSPRLNTQRQHKQTKLNNEKGKAILRILFSRQRKVIEVVQFDASSATGGGEWTKRVFHGVDVDSSFKFNNVILRAPSLLQRDVGKDLQEFVFKCKSIECVLDSTFSSDITICDLEPVGVSAAIGEQHSSKSTSNLGSRPPGVTALTTKYSGPLHTDSSTRGSWTTDTSKVLKESSVQSKPTSIDSRKWHSLRTESIGPSTPKERHSRAMPSFKSFSEELMEIGPHPQTRFMPSVGWCIRYGSKMSHSGRYQIMFIDGVCLNVDVDKEEVEFTNTSGKTTRCNVRECYFKREVGEHMRMFDEFIKMFEDCQNDI